MNTDRGTMKKIIKIYRKRLQDCLQKQGLLTPFIRLNIECILGSYDPNVATNKDEVLFANESKLLTLFEDMCRELYQCSDYQSKTVEIGRAVSYDDPELVQDSHEEKTRKNSRDLLSEGPQNSDEEYLGDDSQVASQHLVSPPSDNIHNVGQLVVHAHVPDIRQHSEQELNPEADAAEYSDDTFSLGSQDMHGVEADQPRAQQSGSAAAPIHPELTQSLLRLEWEVDMARSQTATPEGNTQEVLLVPVQSNVTGYLSQQRRERTQRENPNPWSLARTAAQRRGASRDKGAHDVIGIETAENHLIDPEPSNPAHALSVEGLIRDGLSGMYGVVPKSNNHNVVPDQQSRRDETIPVQRDDEVEADDFELQSMLTPHGAEQILRHQAESGISRNEEQFKNSRASNGFDNLSYEIERDLGIQPDRRAQTPHPSTKLGPNSFFGTPPSSSGPVNKPFRIPARVGPNQQDRGKPDRARQARVSQEGPRVGGRKSDGLAQRKLTFNATKNLGSSEFQDPAIDCLPSMDANYDAFEDGHVGMHQLNGWHRHVSPTPTERVLTNTFERLGALRRRPEKTPQSDLHRPISPSMTEAYENAIERLNALRPQADDIIQTGGVRGYPNQVIDQTENDEQAEERGRTMRRSTTTAPDISPRAYLRKRLASRSRSSNKTHKRMRSEMLPFERPYDESYLQVQSLAIDIQEMEQRAVQASQCDFYVSSGKSELAFNLVPAEMDNISNKLQEIVEIWALEEHGVEVDLEIDVGELLMGDMS